MHEQTVPTGDPNLRFRHYSPSSLQMRKPRHRRAKPFAQGPQEAAAPAWV